jgi:tetratricopeptide (TPR) repeat protein
MLDPVLSRSLVQRALRPPRVIRCVLVLLLAAGAPEARPLLLFQSAGELYRQGVLARSRGDLTRALDLFRRAAEARGAPPEAFFELGLIYYDLRRYLEAEEQFKRFLRARPNSVEAHNNLAAIYAHQGDYGQLHRELETVTRLKPDFVQGQVNLADYYLTMALRTLWKGYQSASPAEREPIKSKILKYLVSDPDRSEDHFVEEGIARLAASSAPTPIRPAPVGQAGSRGFELQVHSTRTRAEAEAQLRRFNDVGRRAEVVQVDLGGRGIWYRIRLTGYETAEQAEEDAKLLIKKGLVREYWIVP